MSDSAWIVPAVTEECIGSGQCVATAPGVFALATDGPSVVTQSPVPPDLAARVLLAAESCPVEAIVISRLSGKPEPQSAGSDTAGD